MSITYIECLATNQMVKGASSLMLQQKRARLMPCSIFYKLTLSSSFKLYLSMMALSFAGYLGSVA